MWASGKNRACPSFAELALFSLFPGSRVSPASQTPLEQTIGGEDTVGGKSRRFFPLSQASLWLDREGGLSQATSANHRALL